MGIILLGEHDYVVQRNCRYLAISDCIHLKREVTAATDSVPSNVQDVIGNESGQVLPNRLRNWLNPLSESVIPRPCYRLLKQWSGRLNYRFVDDLCGAFLYGLVSGKIILHLAMRIIKRRSGAWNDIVDKITHQTAARSND